MYGASRFPAASRLADVRGAAWGIVALRIGASLAWLDSALVGKDAKFAPSFLSGAGLSERITSTFVHTALTPQLSDVLRSVVVPSAHTFAVLIALGDLAVGLSLALGFLTRIGGLLAIARAATNILIVGGAGVDTIGFNAMLILAGAIATVVGAGRRFGVDAWLLARFPDSTLVRILA